MTRSTPPQPHQVRVASYAPRTLEKCPKVLRAVEQHVEKYGEESDAKVFVEEVQKGKPFELIEHYLMRDKVRSDIQSDAKALLELKESAEYYEMPKLAHECQQLLDKLINKTSDSTATPVAKKRVAKR